MVRILLQPPPRGKHADVHHYKRILIGCQGVINHSIKGGIIDTAVFQPNNVAATLVQITAIGHIQVKSRIDHAAFRIGLQIRIQIWTLIEIGCCGLPIDH